MDTKTEHNLEISLAEFKKLSREERKVIRNKGDGLCQKFADDFLAKHPEFDFVIYAYSESEKEKFYIVEKNVWRNVPPAPDTPFLDYLDTIQERIDKIVFTFYKGIMVQGITDPDFDKEFEGYYW